MKNLKEMLKAMSDKAIEALAIELWESYEDDGEDGIGAYLDVDRKEASEMLDYTTLDELPTPADLADCMKVYKSDGSEEAYLRAELRRIRAREAEIKARLKELEEESKEEETELLDPYMVLKAEGEEVLQEKLGALDIKDLRRVVKDHRLDTARRSTRWKEDRLIELIVTTTMARAKQGEVFRNYKD